MTVPSVAKSGCAETNCSLLNDLKRKAEDWDEAQKQKKNKTSAGPSTSENCYHST